MSHLAENCAFQTERLLVANWRSVLTVQWPSGDLVTAVIGILTPSVTASLPPGWQGEYTPERAKQWIAERETESTVLSVVERSSQQVVGLMLLGDEALEGGSTEIHLGYMLAESLWDKGFASEVVAGFVEWCRQQPGVAVIAAGVETTNIASQRVLEKCGFVRVGDDRAEGEQLYRIELL